MTIPFSIFLIAAGLIVRYALHFDVAGVEEDTLGAILVFAGGLGLMLGLIMFALFRYDDTDPRFHP